MVTGPKSSTNRRTTKAERRSATDLRAVAILDLECPRELPPTAREEWNRIVGELIALGVLSRFDRGPLAVYCAAHALWLEAMEAVREYGMMIKSPNGHPMQSPYVAVLNHQADVMLRVAGEFGFTPASRRRIFSFTKNNSMLLDGKEEESWGSMG